MKVRKKRRVCAVAVVAATALISCAVTIAALRGGVGNTVIMSAGEYARYRQFMALEELAEKIEDEFYGEVPARDELVAGAASGMVSLLEDQYARYYTAEEYEEYLSSVNGEYYGIGLLVGQPDDTGAAVLKVYEGGPAQAAGVAEGDVIIHVSGQPVANMPIEQLSSLIASESSGGMVLELIRGGERLSISVTGDDVTVQHVEYAMLEQGTGYIAISMFSGYCDDEFSAALKELKTLGCSSLVIDLRDNPGGSLDIVVNVANELLGKGMRIVSVGSGTEDDDIYEADGESIGMPVAMLVNGNSASASEILAAAIQENGIGAVVGTRTFGKGIVQTTMPVESTGGWLKLTTDAYYTPNGNNIHGVGITPDIQVELEGENQPDNSEGTVGDEDTQLRAALEYVLAMVS